MLPVLDKAALAVGAVGKAAGAAAEGIALPVLNVFNKGVEASDKRHFANIEKKKREETWKLEVQETQQKLEREKEILKMEKERHATELQERKEKTSSDGKRLQMEWENNEREEKRKDERLLMESEREKNKMKMEMKEQEDKILTMFRTSLCEQAEKRRAHELALEKMYIDQRQKTQELLLQEEEKRRLRRRQYVLP